jgi:hypothetical protein
MSKKQISNYKFVPGAIPLAYNQYPKTVSLLTNNRAFLVAETDAYIRAQTLANTGNGASPYYNYVYNTTKSNARQIDTGYNIDAIVYDLTYGGNSLTYQTAADYYINGVTQLATPAIDIDVKTWLRDRITNYILTNTTYTRLNSTVLQDTNPGNPGEDTGISRTSTLANYIINVVNSGLGSLPTVIAPNNQNSNLLPQTVALIELNKRFVQEEAIAYIAYNVANNISPFAFYTYNTEKCRRDVSYVLEGYISDLKHGGNRQTYFNSSKYFDGNVAQVDGDRQPEIYTHTFIRDLISNYILTNTVFSARQTVVSQVVDQGYSAELGGIAQYVALTNIVVRVITNGLSSLPTKITNRGYVKMPGYFKLKDILLVTNTSRNTVLYNFADPLSAGEITYSNEYDSDFGGALYGNEQITTLTFDVNTTGMMVTDNIQIFVEGKEQAVRLNSIGTDAMERAKVGIPQSMLDADFEYGLQPTKWQTVSMMRNYPSVYEIPGSDKAVVSVVTDASANNSPTGVGASTITVTTLAAHSFNVGDIFTIKALASSVLGFGRAEGTFIIASIISSTQFTYFAKSKVGTVNPTTLSSSYTQLRAAGFYTGASVGNPSFNVYSNGQSGTATTSLITSSGSNFFAFTGTAPVVGAPITGTGIVNGTQITAVVGNGGVAVSTKLISTAAVSANTIVVTSTTGLLPGLAFDRGDGTAVQVTDITGNTVSLSGPLTSAILGTNQTYTGISQSSTTGSGSGAVFNISRLSSTYSVAIGSSAGSGYVPAEVITIAGTNANGASPGNDITVTVSTASPRNQVDTLDLTTLSPGTTYTDALNVATTTNGAGTGLTVDITTAGGVSGGIVIDVQINNPGSGYTAGDIITISGGNGAATILVLTVLAGGSITAFTSSGTAVTAPTKNFISAVTLSDATTSSIASATVLNYTSIATIEIVFTNPHGFVPGDSITVTISSSGSNSQYAAGAYYIEQIPTISSLRYTARAPGTIANTLVGSVYSRPDSYYVHRPLDGGVQLGTGGPAHGATAIRMSKKYIRYQSGKGVSYNTGALFAPSYDIQSITSTGTTVGSIVTLLTDDVDHGCQVGAQIQVSGITTSGYNGIYTVSKINTERSLSFVATQFLAATTGVLGTPCIMSVRGWHGATVRSGTFDDQNGMFYQYDGMRMALVKRSSTFNLAGTINVSVNGNNVTGTNTRFTQQLASGDRIVIRGMSHVVTNVASDTALSVSPDYRGVVDVVGAKACKTIDLIVPQEQWNLDTLNGSGPSGYNLDVTKMQMIGMQWTWYGAGFIDFMLRGPTGDYVFAHRFRNSNINTEAYMRTGNQPVRYEVINEGAKTSLSASITSTATVLPLTNAFYFPTSGTVLIENELIRFTGNDGTNLTGCVRGTTLNQFVAGSNRTFSCGTAATHDAGKGVVLVSNTITPIISHWGSAFMIDGQFDSDRGYIFNYASTGVTASVDPATSFLIRLAPSVSNAIVGDLGERELLNRAQLLLSSIAISSDSVAGGGAIIVQGILNPINYPTDPTKITWTTLSSSAAGGQPSFAQIASGGSVTWSGNTSTSSAVVQGAFTTPITARSFASATSTLTARSFASVTQTASAQSFGYAANGISAISFNSGSPYTPVAQTLTAIGFANSQPYGNNSYVNATNIGRSDILITNTQYDSLGSTIQAGDSLTGANFNAATTIASITRAFNGGAYTRIVLSNNPTVTSTAGAGQNVTATTSTNTRYTSATLVTRRDVLITDAAYAALSPTPQVGDSITGTNLTGGTTIAGITTSYNGGTYTRILLSVTAGITSIAGTGNNVSLTISTAYSATYNSALSAARNDLLITNTAYDALTASTPLAIGDTLSVATYLTGGQTVTGFTRGYITIAGTDYTRITMSANANSTSTGAATNGAQNITVTFTSSLAATYNNALTTARSDFLITQTEYASGSANVTDVLSVATYVTGSQTISSITQNYTTIAGVSYARIIMSGNANATSTAGAGNNVAITATSALTATYARAFNTNRADFLVTDADWTSSGAATGDTLSVSTYLTGGQTIQSVTTAFATLGAVSHTRVVMSANANANSTSGAGNNVAVTVTAAGSASSYASKNFLFFTSASWLASGATIGTKLNSTFTAFPAGSSVTQVATRTFNNQTSAVTAASSTGGGSTQTYTLTGTTVYPVGSSVTVSGITGGTYNGTFVVTSSVAGTLIVTGTGTGTATDFTGATVVGATAYRITFTQAANGSISAGSNADFKFGAQYALPGEQVFSFITNPGETNTLSLEALKELTATAIGGRGTFPNGPDVLAINVYKVAGSNTNCNVIVRWGEAQA